MALNVPQFISSTAFDPEQDFTKLRGEFPKRVESEDKRYSIDPASAVSGQNGVVFKGFDTVLERPIALKISLISSESEESIIRTARRLKRIKDPGVMEVQEIVFFKFDGKEKIGVITEWVEGKMLHEANFENYGEYAVAYKSVAKTLDNIHRDGAVHGDIAPDNVKIGSRDGAVRTVLLDWNLSNLGNDKRRSFKTGLASQHAVDTKELIPEDDNWALLACVYITLAGKSPFGQSRDKTPDKYYSLVENRYLQNLLPSDVLQRLDEFFLGKFCGDIRELNSATELIDEVVKIIPEEFWERKK